MKVPKRDIIPDDRRESAGISSSRTFVMTHERKRMRGRQCNRSAAIG
jgi:hypothetical protein